MSVGSHITELKKKHDILSDQVEKIQNRPSVDPLKVVSLKKQKLKIKEEIARLSP
jgi:hypothetical protein